MRDLCLEVAVALTIVCGVASAQSNPDWNQLDNMRDTGELAGAEKLSIAIASDALSTHGSDSLEYGMALVELGTTRLLLGYHDAALVDLIRAQQILDAQLPIFSEKMIAAFAYLGAARHANGQFDQAIDAFSRAEHISHRQWGVKNEAQIRIVYAKAQSLQAMGDWDAAQAVQHHALELHRTIYGVQSAEAIAASARYGTWLRMVGDYSSAIAHFHDAIAELNDGGDDPLESYPLLQGMAHAYRGGFRGKHARGMFRRLIALIDAHPDHFDVDQRIQARLDFGDWLIQRYYERPAVEQYEAAWEIAAQAGPAGKHWIDTFSWPQIARYGAMAPTDLTGENHHVEFQLNITDQGRPRRVRVIEHAPDAPVRALARARQEFADLNRYRPAIVNGSAVASEAIRADMYLVPDGVPIEPAPVEAPARLTANDFPLDDRRGFGESYQVVIKPDDSDD